MVRKNVASATAAATRVEPANDSASMLALPSFTAASAAVIALSCIQAHHRHHCNMTWLNVDYKVYFFQMTKS